MERLIARDGEFVEWKGRPLYMMGPADIYVMAERLAAYEDIAELCGGIDRLRELAEADKAGRLAVLPYEVYETDGVRVYEHAVQGIIYKTAGGPDFDESAIGKSIFLTRAEAERAMEGRKDGN